MIAISTGFLYWALVTNLDREDNRILSDHLSNFQLLLQSTTPGPSEPEAAIRALSLNPFLPEQPLIYVRVQDDSGRVLFETPGMAQELPPTPRPPSLAGGARLSGQAISRSGKVLQVLGVQVGSAAGEPSGLRYLQVAMDRSGEEKLLTHYRERLWLVLGLSVVVCAIVGFLIARSGIRPVERISRTAERIRSTTLHERIEVVGLPIELSGLAAIFNDMLDRLEDAFTRVKRFSDDVAHELRTPVNNLRVQIEVALGKGRTGEDYREVLESCLEECGRIASIIQSLLFLARADSAEAPLHIEAVAVEVELEALTEFYEGLATDAGVYLTIDAPSSLTARVDRTLFRQAIGNLISNAIAHTDRGGRVSIAARHEGALITLTVSDTGCGISAEHLPHLFERFYRVDRARSGTLQGHNVGLGLAVVKSIVVRHGGRVDIRSRLGEGTGVTTTWP